MVNTKVEVHTRRPLGTSVIPGFTGLIATVWLVPFVAQFLVQGGVRLPGMGETESLMALTAISVMLCALGTIIHGAVTNRPEVLAPGVVPLFYMLSLHNRSFEPVSWGEIFGLSFVASLAFVVLAMCGGLVKIAKAMPTALKEALFYSIGLFLMLQALKAGGLLTAGARGEFFGVLSLSRESVCFLIGCGAIFLCGELRRVRNSAILVGVVAAALAAFVLGLTTWPAALFSVQPFVELTRNVSPTSFTLPGLHLLDEAVVFLVLLVVDVVATYEIVSSISPSLQAEDKTPRRGRLAQSILGLQMLISSFFSTATQIVTFESTSVVAAGGRDRRSAFVTGGLYLLLLFILPLIALFPVYACAPALFAVGYAIHKATFRFMFMTHDRQARYLLIPALFGCLILGSMSLAVLLMLAALPLVQLKLWKSGDPGSRGPLFSRKLLVSATVALLCLALIAKMGMQ